MVSVLRYFIAVIFLFLIAGCSMLQNNPQENKSSVCKELNYRIINNGATGNRLLATQQGAEIETLTRSYHQAGCS
ncbi:MAG: hypothetical protein K0R24_1338 [Gammaproteobacteria bacterium]|jgi:hypothetical protein|nr:hypothetical protein [Gammaproteobacteria bacterium]MCE3238357.1 hypothetical protein [Gammaproteobacteria bacterium]